MRWRGPGCGLLITARRCIRRAAPVASPRSIGGIVLCRRLLTSAQAMRLRPLATGPRRAIWLDGFAMG